MAILSWISSMVVLLVVAITLNFVGQSLEGRDSIFIHFGWITLVPLVGAALFPCPIPQHDLPPLPRP